MKALPPFIGDNHSLLFFPRHRFHSDMVMVMMNETSCSGSKGRFHPSLWPISSMKAQIIVSLSCLPLRRFLDWHSRSRVFIEMYIAFRYDRQEGILPLLTRKDQANPQKKIFPPLLFNGIYFFSLC